MEYLLFSQYSFGRFTPTLLLAIISFYLIFRIKRTATSQLIGVYFFVIMLYNLGHFLSYSILHPVGGYAWLMVSMAPFGGVAMIQFAYRFPRLYFPRRAKRALVISLLFTLAGYLLFVYEFFSTPLILNEQHYGTLPSKHMPLVALVMYLWMPVVFLRQAISAAGEYQQDLSFKAKLRVIFKPYHREVRAARNFALIMLFDVFHVILLILFHNLKALSFITVNTTSNTIYLFIVLFYVIVYINNSNESISFMFKLVAVTMVTVLAIIGTIGHVTLSNFEKYYDDKNNRTVSLVREYIAKEDYSELPDEIEYIVVHDPDTMDHFELLFSGKKHFKLPAHFRIWDHPATSTELYHEENPGSRYIHEGRAIEKVRFFTQIKGKNYYQYNINLDGRFYGVGFNYIQYRQQVHQIARHLIVIILLVMAAIVIVFPLLFHVGLVRPLSNLLYVVQKVNRGEMHDRVPIRYNDEVGYLTESFNVMIDSVYESRAQLQEYAYLLEEKVSQRTSELNETMIQLRDANNELTSTRDELWGEMELARKLQTSLLPLNPKVPGYEIGVYMNPADEVGGDYYDVINVGGYSWLVIGDVSGHGVQAGLIMMMVQTAIHTVLAGNPGVSTNMLLNQINTVITDNVKMLQENRYITITVFCEIEKGNFHFSGQHQDIILYRSHDAALEVIKTDGMWLGLTSDIMDMLDVGTLELRPGDIMLLYTDGITEAWLKGADNKNAPDIKNMFGNDLLADILLKNGNKTPVEIQQAVLDELTKYHQSDDVTMIIIKRIE